MTDKEKMPYRNNGYLRRLILRAGSSLIIGVSVLMAIGCTAREKKHYEIQYGLGTYGHIYQKPTQQILQIHDGACRRDVNCTADLLRRHGKVIGGGAKEWKEALDKDRTSLKKSLDEIRAGNAKCLYLHQSLSGNLSFWVSSKPAWCKVGQPLDP